MGDSDDEEILNKNEYLLCGIKYREIGRNVCEGKPIQ